MLIYHYVIKSLKTFMKLTLNWLKQNLYRSWILLGVMYKLIYKPMIIRYILIIYNTVILTKFISSIIVLITKIKSICLYIILY